MFPIEPEGFFVGEPSLPTRAAGYERTHEVVARCMGARNKMRLSRRVVPVDKVVGSVGRSRDFDGEFLPTRRSMEQRWKRVDTAFHLGVDLPPVVLYKLGESYYVLDGNHRISVARFQGVRWIEAEVTRVYVGRSSATSKGSSAVAVDGNADNVEQSAAA